MHNNNYKKHQINLIIKKNNLLLPMIVSDNIYKLLKINKKKFKILIPN